MLIVVFIVYLVLVMGIALWSLRHSKTTADYVVGGKKISGTALALSERATGESAWLLLGLTGHAYAEGISALWVAIGCVAGVLFIWFAMSDPLRREADRTGAMTVSSLLSRKFPGSEKPIGLLSSIIVVFFFLFYIAAQYSGAGSVLQQTFGLDPFWGMVIGSLVVTFYTMLGGFVTVVATDVFQAILMIVTLVVLPIVGLVFAGVHHVGIAQALQQAGPQLSSLTGGTTGAAAVLFVLSGMSWAFGYTGQPQLLTRMIAMRSREDVVRAKWVAMIWTLLAYAGAMVIGIVGFALTKAGTFGTDATQLAESAERILPVMILTLLNPLLGGILLSGAISAMMSTASSQLMVCSSSASEDVYGNLTQRRMTPRKELIFNKLLTLAVGLIAFVLALTMQETVYGLVSYAWSGIGSSFGPALVLLLFWKRFSRAGVYAAMVAGPVTTIVWYNWLAGPTGVSERLGSYVISFLLAMLFSMLYPEKRGEYTQAA